VGKSICRGPNASLMPRALSLPEALLTCTTTSAYRFWRTATRKQKCATG
jgi:hypothetical protein